MDSPSWSNLPEDLLRLIFQRLTTDFLDVFQCRGVCVSWRSVITQVYRDVLKPLLPPLVLFTNLKKFNRGYYIVSDPTKKKYRMLKAESDGRRYHPSSHGWLLTVARCFPHDIHLLNPFTGAQIRLPPGSTVFRNLNYLRVMTSTSPSDPNCEVIATAAPNYGIKSFAYCKIGDQCWSQVNSTTLGIFDNIFYKDGWFYLIDFYGYIKPLELDGLPKTTNLEFRPLHSPLQSFHDYKYLLESIAGDLLLVTENKGISSRSSVRSFEVYKLDWSKKEWSRMTNLGDQAIFLNKNGSVSVSAGRSGHECRANCIYFTHKEVLSISINRYYIHRYNIATKRIYVRRFHPLVPTVNKTMNWIRPHI